MRKICKFKVPKRYAKGRFAIKAYIGLNQMHVCFFFVSTIKKIIFSHDQKSFQKRMIKMKKKQLEVYTFQLTYKKISCFWFAGFSIMYMSQIELIDCIRQELSEIKSFQLIPVVKLDFFLFSLIMYRQVKCESIDLGTYLCRELVFQCPGERKTVN